MKYSGSFVILFVWNYFKIDPLYCPESLVLENQEKIIQKYKTILQENSRDYKSFDVGENSTEFIEDQTDATPFNEIKQPERLVSSTFAGEESTTILSTKLNNSKTSNFPSPTTLRSKISSLYKNYSTSHAPEWRRKHTTDLQYSPSTSYTRLAEYRSSPIPTSMILMRDKWRSKSGCFYSCVQHSKGLQTVVSKYDFSTSIRLCEPSNVVRSPRGPLLLV